MDGQSTFNLLKDRWAVEWVLPVQQPYIFHLFTEIPKGLYYGAGVTGVTGVVGAAEVVVVVGATDGNKSGVPLGRYITWMLGATFWIYS